MRRKLVVEPSKSTLRRAEIFFPLGLADTQSQMAALITLFLSGGYRVCRWFRRPPLCTAALFSLQTSAGSWRVDYCDAMCDCVFGEVPASELSIALRVTPRVDLNLCLAGTLFTDAMCAGLTDQRPSAFPELSADSTIAQLPLTYTP